MSDPGEPVEFDCEGCGAHVFAIGLTETPAHQLCAVCLWLCEFVADPEAMMTLRKRLDDRQ